MTMRVFAIRLGFTVELRAAKAQPKAYHSKLSKTTDLKHTTIRPIQVPPYIEFINETKPHKITLKQTTFIGGRWIGLVPYKVFQQVAGPLAINDLKEITPEQKRILMSHTT